MDQEGAVYLVHKQIKEALSMFRRLWFWVQKKRNCRGFCMTCKHYKECSRELLRERG